MSTEIQEHIEEEVKTSMPNLWRVIFHNDNKTTMEFVVFLLVQVFHKKDREALAIMLDVHEKGQGTAGLYTHEIAENKMHICIQTAREHDFPLVVTIEEEL